MIPHKLRPAVAEDHNFVGASYAASWKRGADLFWTDIDLPQRGNASTWYNAEVDRRLAAMWPTVVVVEGEVGLLGWGAATGDFLHYVYVKQPYRFEKLATAIWGWYERPMSTTHWTRAMRYWRPWDRNKINCSFTYIPTYWRDEYHV